jgi:glycosyltransferase involved in cell wall biosynthesis
MKKNRPLVTNYTINRNYGKYIEKCIDSVLNQTYKNIEYIIIDDGSTDNSVHLIKKYLKKSNIKAYFQKNIGFIKSINKALKIANGKFIMRLDSDDYLERCAVLNLIKNIYKHKSDIVFPDYYLVNENAKILKRVKRHNFNKNVTLYNQPAHGACTLYKKSVFEEVGYYSKKFDCQDGVYMWMKVINKYKISNINKPLFYYRQHQKSLTRNYKKILTTKVLIYDELNKRKKKNLCFFPIRDLNEINKNSKQALKILIKKIFEIKKIKKIHKIIINSKNEQLENYFNKFKINKIQFIKRNDYLSSYGLGLSELLYNTIKNNKKSFEDYKNIIIFTYNNLDTKNISLLINNLDIFNLDVAILAQINKKLLFKHDGKGLKPVVKYKSGLQIERDTIFSMVSEIFAIKKSNFLKHKKLLSGKIGHVLIDEV